MYVYDTCLFFMSVVVTVWGNVCCVAAVVENSFLALRVIEEAC